MEFTLFLTGAVVAVSILIALLGRRIGAWITWIKAIIQLRSLPSPPRRWFLGHSRELGPDERSIEYLLRNCKNYPKFCVYWVGFLLASVQTYDVDAVKILFLRPEEPKSIIYKYMIPWIGDGLVVTSGKKWRRYRKLLTPSFHLDNLKQYVSAHNEMADKLLEMWEPFAGTGKSVDITKYAPLYTLDVLLRCLCSVNSNCLEEGDSMEYVNAVNKLTMLFVKRTITPLHAIDWIYNISTAGRKFKHYCDILHKFTDDVILQRRDELLKGTKSARKHLDFLDILLSTKDEDGEGLTDTEIREEVDTFVFAGHDTTAAALGWCLYCMAKHKEHQDLCRKEIREILAGRDSDELTMEDLYKLTYTTMCIKETLRMFPPVPIISKHITEDIMIGGHRIPKGVWTQINIYALHHNLLVWDDPETFDPLRFSLENSKNRDPFAYVPFAAGSRNCIGQLFALHELKVTISHVLNKFELELDPDHVIKRRFQAILQSGTGIKLKMNIAL